VRTEAVDRFGREGYKTATPEALGGTRNDAPIGIVGIHAKYFGHELVLFLASDAVGPSLEPPPVHALTLRISSGTAAPGVYVLRVDPDAASA
jgi:hypothetical protein